MDAKQLLSIARDQYLHDLAAVEVDGAVRTYYAGFDLSEFARRLLESDLYAPPKETKWVEVTMRQPDSTCYIERSKVREIIMALSNLYVHAAEEVLAKVDKLPIFTKEDIKP